MKCRNKAGIAVRCNKWTAEILRRLKNGSIGLLIMNPKIQSRFREREAKKFAISVNCERIDRTWRRDARGEEKMVGANLKAETMTLMDKRAAMETEMNSIVERLCNPGGPGLSGNLIDSEGFPREDIDIPVVRAERRRLAELRSEHGEITEKINVNIQILHSVRPTSRASSTKDSGPEETSLSGAVNSLSASIETSGFSVTSSAMDVDVVTSIPFAMVDEINESSPAAEDGLQLGDQVLKFGNVEGGDNLLQRLAAEAQSNQGQAVSVQVMRQGAKVGLSVTPRIWQGRGLLGCHFRLV
ncbi:26S proteasome non-ATPase regulatory subunit 9 [Arabidopsis lyrata subsp. lyrata]|uniref:26S proteasome non-ATPase regulatory subunit 9 n=1 Tax=Arabidopsis lyrata subsp. lyrata TaxID=81972 RepID=UPI000A29A822|nr:26S proteasome non-ATPase regulatory subunit 9 [Arabidopsis lyrata subsp. lyrata]|eukprot:XP_020881277.1 26S proteasome non-ATPase regulatory subunit 9 [Arabidopsis lyrata subsp. lyrata]